MTVLLVVTAVLLLVSGVVKLRAGERAGLGLHLLSVLEVLAGFGLAGVSFTSLVTPALGLGMVLASVALVLVASLHMWMQLKGAVRKRELSEGARLRTYVEYLPQAHVLDESPRDPEDQGLT